LRLRWAWLDDSSTASSQAASQLSLFCRPPQAASRLCSATWLLAVMITELTVLVLAASSPWAHRWWYGCVFFVLSRFLVGLLSVFLDAVTIFLQAIPV